MEIKSIILAGSHGFLMEPLSLDRPKAMLPLVNKPILGYIINSLNQYGLKEIIISVHFRPSIVSDYFGNGNKFGVNISYLNEETLTGTAGPVKKLEDQLSDTFLVIYGDSLFEVDLIDLIKFHKRKRSIATIVYHKAPDPTTCGIFLTDENGRVIRFQEKPKKDEVFSNKASAAIYALEPEILQYIPSNQTFDFAKDLFPLLLENKKPIYGYSIGSGYRYDIGTIEQYRKSHVDILTGKVNKNIDGKRIDGNIWVGENTQINPTAQLYGPIVIGRNCTIDESAIIDKVTVIGDNVNIGQKSIIKKSIIWEHTRLSADARLEDCIVGAECRIGNKVSVLSDAVLGSKCVVEKGKTIEMGIKLFPEN